MAESTSTSWCRALVSAGIAAATVLAPSHVVAAQEGDDTVLAPVLEFEATKTATIVPPPAGIADVPDGVTIDGMLDVAEDCDSGGACELSSSLDVWPQTPFGEAPAVAWQQSGGEWALPATAHFVSADYGESGTCVYIWEDTWTLQVVDSVLDGERTVATRLEGRLVRRQALDPGPSAAAIANELCPPYETVAEWDVVATSAVTAVAPPPSTSAAPAPEPTAAPAEVTDTAVADPPTDEGSNSRGPVIAAVVVLALLVTLVVVWRSIRSTQHTVAGGPDEEDPPIFPPSAPAQHDHEVDNSYCDWELDVKTASKPDGQKVRRATGNPCCYVVIDIESTLEVATEPDTVRHEEIAMESVVTMAQAADDPSPHAPDRSVEQTLIHNRVDQRQAATVKGINGSAVAQVNSSKRDVPATISIPGRVNAMVPSSSEDARMDAIATDVRAKTGYELGSGGPIEFRRTANLTDETHIEVDVRSFCPPDETVTDVHAEGSGEFTYGNTSGCNHGVLGDYGCQGSFTSVSGGASKVSGDLDYDVDEKGLEVTSGGSAAGVSVSINEDSVLERSVEAWGIKASAKLMKAEGHNHEGRTLANGSDDSNDPQRLDIYVRNALSAQVRGEIPVNGETVRAESAVYHDLTIRGETEKTPTHPEGPCRKRSCRKTDCRCDPEFTLRFADENEPFDAELTVEGTTYHLTRPLTGPGVTRWNLELVSESL